MKFRQFLAQFHYDPAYHLAIGIERERFIVNRHGDLSPAAVPILRLLSGNLRIKPEFSACQLEDVTETRPKMGSGLQEFALRNDLQNNHRAIEEALHTRGFRSCFDTVGPPDMPLDIYPKERYRKIAKTKSHEQIAAACRVIGVHVHIGMLNMDMALHVYNQAVRQFTKLCAMGGVANQERLKLYGVVAPNYCPPPYSTLRDFYDRARAEKFTHDPRQCWDMIRLSTLGSIEFRVFPATADIEQIIEWAKHCRDLCQQCLSS